MRKVDEGVREVISNALTGDAREKLGGFVTITDVNTSPDLRNAHVYVSVFGDERERSTSLEALEELRIELQTQIATHLRMKFTPILKFEYDDSVERASHVNELINEEAGQFDE